jgi:hypothetical protein
MTEPQQDDLTHEGNDEAVQPTGNGMGPDDPHEQPSQDPRVLPEGTETAQQ